jgi:hypothetical protein
MNAEDNMENDENDTDGLLVMMCSANPLKFSNSYHKALELLLKVTNDNMPKAEKKQTKEKRSSLKQ